MGHLRLGRLPLRQNWVRVVETLADPSTEPSAVAAVTAQAARQKLREASSSPYSSFSYWLLVQLASKAAEPNTFKRFLTQQTIEVDPGTSAVGFLSALTQHLEERRSDFGPPSAIDELIMDAFQETVGNIVLLDAESLFGSSLEDVRRAFARFAPARSFSRLSRVFFGAFYARVLTYFLSYEFANQVGGDGRFGSSEDVEDFERRLGVYARDVSALVEDYTQGWYAKNLWQKEEITEEDCRRFLHFAFAKFQQQLEREVA